MVAREVEKTVLILKGRMERKQTREGEGEAVVK